MDFIVFSKFILTFIKCILTLLYFRKNGKECIARCFQNVIDNPPSIGSIISVKHNSIFNNGTLRNAFYWRERPDIKWNSSINQSHRITVFFSILPYLPFRFLLQIGFNQRIE